MLGAIPKKHLVCETCKNPWFVLVGELHVFREDKTEVIRSKEEYACNVCGKSRFEIDRDKETRLLVVK